MPVGEAGLATVTVTSEVAILALSQVPTADLHVALYVVVAKGATANGEPEPTDTVPIYHCIVPVVQIPDKVVAPFGHIVELPEETDDGAAGIGVTIIAMSFAEVTALSHEVAVLLHLAV